MGRIRTIKPDFFRSASVARLSYRARLTWEGLWTYADDEGRGRDDPRDIKGQLWPQDDTVTWVEVVEDMDELVAAEKLARYVVDGENYFYIPSWHEHQKISKPTPSRFPNPSGSPPGALPAGKGKGREGNREGGAFPGRPAPFCEAHPKGTRESCRPCGDARRARAAWDVEQKNKPIGLGKMPRKGDGHECIDDGNGWCPRCQERMEQ